MQQRCTGVNLNASLQWPTMPILLFSTLYQCVPLQCLCLISHWVNTCYPKASSSLLNTSKSHKWEVLFLATKSREESQTADDFFSNIFQVFSLLGLTFISSCFLEIGAVGTFFPAFLFSLPCKHSDVLPHSLQLLFCCGLKLLMCQCHFSVYLISQFLISGARSPHRLSVPNQPALCLDRIAWVGSNTGFISVLELTPGSDALHAPNFYELLDLFGPFRRKSSN